MAHRLGYQQNLDEQILQFRQIPASKVGNRVVVRVHVTGNEAQGDYFVGGSFNLTRTENTRCITIKQQSQQHFRCVWWCTLVTILLVNWPQIKLGNHIDNESSQVIGRQDIAQRDLQASVFS
jgi:hypothetical protein